MGAGIVGNDRCGSGGPLKRSYVITGSHTPFEQRAEGGGGGGVGGWGFSLPTLYLESRGLGMQLTWT